MHHDPEPQHPPRADQIPVPADGEVDADTTRRQVCLIGAAAQRAVLDEPALDAEAVAQALGGDGSEDDLRVVGALRRESRLVGLPQGAGDFLYPSFQLDVTAGRVHPVVEAVNRLLDAVNDPWGVASWWISAAPRLRGAAARDLIGTDRDSDLLVLARNYTRAGRPDTRS